MGREVVVARGGAAVTEVEDRKQKHESVMPPVGLLTVEVALSVGQEFVVVSVQQLNYQQNLAIFEPKLLKNSAF